MYAYIYIYIYIYICGRTRTSTVSMPKYLTVSKFIGELTERSL